MQKVYWDNVNGKEVVDVTGMKDEAQVKADHGLDVATQVVSVDTDAGEASEVIAGTLTVFDADARADTDATAREVTRQAAEDATKTNLSLDQQGYDDLVASLK